MKDRVSLYPGRVKLTPVSGQENTYDMVRADEPTQAGTPLNKATFLKDDTASIFGLGADAVPNDVLNVLAKSVLLNDATVTLPSSAQWRSVTYGNGKFVAVADGSNAVAYSADGIKWESANLPSSAPWVSVTYGNGKFVAVAFSYSAVAYSTNGVKWAFANLPYNDSWQSVTYGNGKFVAVAYNSDKAAYSADGVTWEPAILPSSDYWHSVTYGNGKFVAVAIGSDKAAYSADGVTWSSANLPSSDSWFSVTYGNGKLVAVAYNSDKAAYSADGVTWSSAVLPSSAYWFSVTYGNGKFVAVAHKYTKIAYSTDGVTWADTAPALQNVSGDNIADDIGSVLGVTKIETGSYVGTGTYGESNPCSLTFNFVPKVVAIITAYEDLRSGPPYPIYANSLSPSTSQNGWNDAFLWVQNEANAQTRLTVQNSTVYVTRNGNTLSWYSGNAGSQLNTANTPYDHYSYHYVAIGNKGE